jgi:hypothetical protein
MEDYLDEITEDDDLDGITDKLVVELYTVAKKIFPKFNGVNDYFYLNSLLTDIGVNKYSIEKLCEHYSIAIRWYRILKQNANLSDELITELDKRLKNKL